jgi:hypothetical protein
VIAVDVAPGAAVTEYPAISPACFVASRNAMGEGGPAAITAGAVETSSHTEIR